jgi:hypothetical protein
MENAPALGEAGTQFLRWLPRNRVSTAVTGLRALPGALVHLGAVNFAPAAGQASQGTGRLPRRSEVVVPKHAPKDCSSYLEHCASEHLRT